ncbi:MULTISPECIES: AAA family ATPase [Ralstonia]|uniref:AAA family ATPase n=1 Tax=Ralstonia TaxID=48736 RepID=UPI000DD35BF5|nr:MULTISPECIES: AAA family ATPase [Ralstonia]
MSAPEHPSEHPPGFLPLGDLAALRSAATWRLLIPSDMRSALAAARQDKEPKEEIPGFTVEEPSSVASAAQAPATRRARLKHIQVFGPAALALASENLQGVDRNQQRYAQLLLEQARTNDGYRALPRARSALKKLETALTLFGNLREPIQKLRIDLTLMSAMRAKDFRVRPILLTGQPGVGKTHFALKLAEILNVPMRKWSAGSAQASFQLTGSDSAWHHARPGMIVEMLAGGKSATPVLILDEVDKIGSDGRYPVTPVLLDLLESGTASAFQDAFFRMTFDASRIIYVLTANDPDAVPAPLLSRVEVFDIPAPEPEQRLQLILAEVRRLQRATGKRIELDASAAEALSERSDVDLRATHRLVQDAFATAMASGKAVAVLKVPRRAARLAIGFAAYGQTGERA